MLIANFLKISSRLARIKKMCLSYLSVKCHLSGMNKYKQTLLGTTINFSGAGITL